MKKGTKKCDICGEYKKDTTVTYNPYVYELENEKIYQKICDDCHDQLVEDV